MGERLEGFCSSSDSCHAAQNRTGSSRPLRHRCPCGGWWPSSQTFLGSFVVLEQNSFLSVFCVFISQWPWKRVPFMMADGRAEERALGPGLGDHRQKEDASSQWLLPGLDRESGAQSWLLSSCSHAAPPLAPLPTSPSSCRGGNQEGCPHPASPAPETPPSACLWLGFSLSPCKAMVFSEEINLTV